VSDKTKIEWSDATWTPIRARRKDDGKIGVHCERISPGCQRCYSATFNHRRLPNQGTGLDFTVPNREKVDIFLDEKILTLPLKWKKGRKIFVCSQTDLFAEFVPVEFIARVFNVMADCPRHTFQLLTKRADRMQHILYGPKHHGLWTPKMWHNEVLPNVHLGVSVETPEYLWRVAKLLGTPAARRFVSYEPALAGVDFSDYLQPSSRLPGRHARISPGHWIIDADGAHLMWRGLDQIIDGGESGPGARPMQPDWARSVRDQCVASGTAFFFKQWGGVQKKKAGRELDGREWSEFPK
jgi:protein gp37